MKTNLDYWEDSCSIEQFKSWCHKDCRWKKIITKRIISFKPVNILDVGCGTAHMGEIIKRLNPNVKYKGVERTPKFVEYNKKNGFDCIHGDINSLQIETDSYDCVLCLDVLNYCLDHETALKELSRVSRDKVIMSFFKNWGNGEIIKRKDDTGLCEVFYNLEEFRKSIELANMSIVEEINLNKNLNGPKIIICEKLKRGEE